MKTEITLWTRVRFTLMYVFKPEHKGGVYNKCSVCESSNIKLIENRDYTSLEDVTSYSRMECLNCGSTAGAVQTWKIKAY